MTRTPAEALVRLRRPQTTVRWRLTLLYGIVFLICGAALLAITYALVAHAAANRPLLSSFMRDHFGRVPPQVTAASRFIRAQEKIAYLHQLEVESGVALAIMAIVTMGLGWIVAGRVLRPLRTMTSATREISENNLHRRLAMNGPRDELRELAATIDGLLQRLETAFDAQRRFVANASHELRTPLAMMRTTLDVAVAKPNGVPAQTRELDVELRLDLDHADRLLESFLVLARAQHHGLGEERLVGLEPIIATALASQTPEIRAAEIAVHTELAPVRVRGSETLLARMIGNVVENAVRYNEPHGSIRVALGRHGDRARLVVDSSGALLEDAAVAQLAEPFRRLNGERTGSHNGHGLGLSIVGAIARAHGGTLELHALPVGGLRVSLELPAASTPEIAGPRP